MATDKELWMNGNWSRCPTTSLLYLLSIKTLVEDDTNRPYIHLKQNFHMKDILPPPNLSPPSHGWRVYLGGNLGRVFANDKALWGKVPGV